MEQKTCTYKLILTSEEIRETLKAVELLMRLKLGQSFTFSDSLVGWDTTVGLRRANELVAEALKTLYGDKTHLKDDEWYRLYNLYQVMRYALHEAEHPDTQGVDSYPPMRTTDVPLPKCEWSENDGQRSGTV